MPPRAPRDFEISQLRQIAEEYREDDRQKRYREQYDKAFALIGGFSGGTNSPLGYLLYRNSPAKKYNVIADYTDGKAEVITVMYRVHQEALRDELPPLGDLRDITAPRRWDGIPIELRIVLVHDETDVRQEHPVAVLSPDKILWCKNGLDEVVAVDIDEESDELTSIRDTLDFLASED